MPPPAAEYIQPIGNLYDGQSNFSEHRKNFKKNSETIFIAADHRVGFPGVGFMPLPAAGYIQAIGNLYDGQSDFSEYRGFSKISENIFTAADHRVGFPGIGFMPPPAVGYIQPAGNLYDGQSNFTEHLKNFKSNIAKILLLADGMVGRNNNIFAIFVEFFSMFRKVGLAVI